MKLIFFLVAFCLLSIRVYFSWSGRDREKRGESVSDMVIKSDNFYEEMKYAGKFQLTDDETAFKSISPGGYFKFRKNEERIKAESNLQGTIEYTIYDGKNNLGMSVEGKRLVAEAIREMIDWGFDAPARLERIYRNGGSRALLNEIDSMKSDPVKMLYLDRLFTLDSLSSDEWMLMANRIGSLGSDMDKANLFRTMIDKGLANGNIFDSLLEQVSHLGSDMDKINLYRELMKEKNITEKQWIGLIHRATQPESDMDKGNLLVEIASKMPKTETIKSAYLEAARSIHNDSDYGRAVRAVVD